MSADSGATSPEQPEFPLGGGELGALIRAFDWSKTCLGPIARWPQSLKTVTGMLLLSPVPIVLLWGEDGVMIYNDAYSVFAGGRHPRLLGSKVREGWPEVAEFNDNVMKVGLAGDTLAYKDQELILHRNGGPEQVWMNLDYSPVLGEGGRPAGVVAIVGETTERVRAERQVQAEREQLMRLFEQSPGFLAMVAGPEHVFTLTNPAYQRLVGGRDLIGKTVRAALPEVEEQGFLALLDEVYRTGEAYVGRGTRVSLHRGGGTAENRFLDFVYQPVMGADGDVTGIFIEGYDVTERAEAERHLRLVVNELNHRVKNNLAMTQAVAAQTFRNAETMGQAQTSLSSRIAALAQANDLLTGQRGADVSMRGVLQQATRPHHPSPERLGIEGPDLSLSPKTALSLSLAIHELSTNALKYGAWSAQAGVVSIRWSIYRPKGGGAERLTLEWTERGGPRVATPSRRGFGSRLIERGLAAEMGGVVQMRFEPEGLVCVIDAPLTVYAEEGAA